MNSDKYINFFYSIGKSKPNDLHKEDNGCPFCNKEELQNIIEQSDDIILLKNKYPTLENTLQLVIIETEKCGLNISSYSKPHNRKLFTFAINHWLEIIESNEFKSVILYKNHGPMSGGSLKHSHMQIIGLYDINYEDLIHQEYFEGSTIYKNDLCEVNLSTKPLNCFTEFNVIINDINNVNALADNVQILVHYILNNYNAHCDSFNLFFYKIDEQIICKIVPRFVTSPLLLGYSLKQIPNNSKEVIKKIKKLYYTKSD
ncbi:DUF4931 domain-containing protein [Clostridium ihumii]|uniref:DUF4931 domain-containing protein n=1 Tax=Clostridium ihumii TaxID=1470356 RepID=UPI00058D9AFB|nr:DUF4931 domain-containing protein [Clostridium ihumii]